MGFWDTITGLFPGNKDKQDDPAENDRRQAFLLAKVGYPIVNGDNTPDDSGATEDWGVSAGIERGVNAPEAQSLYAKIGGVAPDGASSGAEAPPDTVAAENPTINDEIEEALGTKSDLTGKVQLPPAEPADRQEAAAESGEAEWSALSLDWKSGQENRSGDRSLLPYLTGTVFSSQRDAALQQMDISREYRFALQHQYTAKAYFGDKPVDQSAVSVEYTLDQPLQFGWGLSAGTREATPAKEHSFGEWVDAISISFPPIKFAGAGVLLAANISPKVLKTVGMVRGSKFASEALDLARGPSKAAEGIADAERIVAQDARKISNAKNYRDLFLKENPGMPKELQVHHTLPQKYQEILNGKGINIHETKYLEGINPDIHRLVTKEWQRWEKSLGRTPTAEEVIDFAKQIDSKYSEFWYKK